MATVRSRKSGSVGCWAPEGEGVEGSGHCARQWTSTSPKMCGKYDHCAEDARVKVGLWEAGGGWMGEREVVASTESGRCTDCTDGRKSGSAEWRGEGQWEQPWK